MADCLQCGAQNGSQGGAKGLQCRGAYGGAQRGAYGGHLRGLWACLGPAHGGGPFDCTERKGSVVPDRLL